MPGSSRNSIRPLKTLETAEIALRNPDFIGVTLLGPAFAAARGRRDRRRSAGTQEPDPRRLAGAAGRTTCCWRPPRPPRRSRPQSTLFGELQPGRMDGPQRGPRLSAGVRLEPAPWSGRPWETSAFPTASSCSIAHVRRGDADLMPQPDLVLEVGDRVGLLANRSHSQGHPEVLRRFDPGHGRTQLHFDRHRRRARPAAWE